MKRNNNKGFTLAELLIVVAVIAVLVAVAIPTFTNQLEKARQATDVANLRSAYAAANLNILTQSDNDEGNPLTDALRTTEDMNYVFWYDGTQFSLAWKTGDALKDAATEGKTLMGKATTRSVINKKAVPGGITYTDETLGASGGEPGTTKKGVTVSVTYLYSKNIFVLKDITYSEKSTFSEGALKTSDYSDTPLFGSAPADIDLSEYVSGGVKPYTYALPDGEEANWDLNTETGILKYKKSGEDTAYAAGAKSVTITVKDTAKTEKTLSVTLTVADPGAPTFANGTTVNLPATAAGNTFSGNVSDLVGDVSYGAAEVTMSYTAVMASDTDTLGLAVSENGTFSGTAVAGTKDVSVTYSATVAGLDNPVTGTITIRVTVTP